MAGNNPQVEHLLRRAGFGMSPDERTRLGNMSVPALIDYLVDFEKQPDDVDGFIGDSAYVGVATRGGAFSPNTIIDDARQRWLFRMVHTRRPLQEKMALFWHNHFANAYTKIGGVVGNIQATKMLAQKSGELPGPQGQIELFRQFALGSFRDLLLEVAKDPGMLVFLDGRLNVRDEGLNEVQKQHGVLLRRPGLSDVGQLYETVKFPVPEWTEDLGSLFCVGLRHFLQVTGTRLALVGGFPPGFFIHRYKRHHPTHTDFVYTQE